jgi:HTH-type transcriptional regulator/antitoxin HipB
MRIKTVEMLGELVRDQRKRRGWSQTRLAEKAGVSRLWIGHLERGKGSVELGLVLKTLRVLDLNLEAFPRQPITPTELPGKT